MMNGLSQVIDSFLLNSYPTVTTSPSATTLTNDQTIVASERQLAFETYSNKALETNRGEPCPPHKNIVCASGLPDFTEHNVFAGFTDSDNCLNTYFCDQPLTPDWSPFGQSLIPDNTQTNGSLVAGNDLNNCFVNYDTNYNMNSDSKSNLNETSPQQIPKKSGNKANAAKKLRKEYNTGHKSEKSVSAYALFFRDAQSMIKAANPSASFGEISKIVASNWENLDNGNKNLYKQRAEQEKKRLLKKRAADRAQEIAGLMAAKLGAVAANVTGEAKAKLNRDEHHDSPDCYVNNAGNQQVNQDAFDQNQAPSDQNHQNHSSQLHQDLVSTTNNQAQGNGQRYQCIRLGCTNEAIESAEWDYEYCSTDCCVRHCADVFESWVQRQQNPNNNN